MESNPLKKYMRTPKIYVKLPSLGYYYTDEIDIDASEEELGVMPMTASDELILTTPDALLNGDGLRQVIQSCCPNVQEPGKLISQDSEILFLAIKAASYGDKLKFAEKCPECSHENEFYLSVRSMIEEFGNMDPPYVIEHDKSLKIYVKPSSFDAATKAALKLFESQRLFKTIETEDAEDLDKLLKYNDTFKKIALLNVELIIDNIHKVVINDGNETFVVDDRQQITEWIQNVDLKTVEAIREKVAEINNEFSLNKEKEIECQNEECKHVWISLLEVNPVNFFE